MRVGLYFDLRNPPGWRRDWTAFYADTLALIADAEAMGADSVWLSEHHFFEDGYLPQPLAFAAAVAARTERIRIGTAVLLAPLRPAIQIAEDAAIVDILSGGRLDLGLGAGYRVPEFEAFGTARAGRFQATEDRVREIRRLWGEGGITPGMVQDPAPIWCGFYGPKGARRAGRLGEGLLALAPQLLEPYREGLAEGGHDLASARMAGPAHFLLADDPQEVWAQARPFFEYQWNSYAWYSAVGHGKPQLPLIDAERWRRLPPDGSPPRVGVFTAEEAAVLLRPWLQTMPAVDLFLWASIAGLPDDLVRRHVELVCTRLRPALADL